MTNMMQLTGVVANIVMVVSVAMIVFGGFKYMTSMGNRSVEGKAKNIMVYNGQGLVISCLTLLFSNVFSYDFVTAGNVAELTAVLNFMGATMLLTLLLAFISLMVLSFLGETSKKQTKEMEEKDETSTFNQLDVRIETKHQNIQELEQILYIIQTRY